MKVSLNLKRCALVAGVLLFAGLLTWAYIDVIAPVYAYRSFILLERSPQYYLFAALLVAVPALWMPVELHRASETALWFVYLMVFIPSIVVPVFATKVSEPSLFVLHATILAGFLILSLVPRVSLLRLPEVRLGRVGFLFAVGTLTAILYAAVIQSYGFNINIVSFAEVYDVRAQYKAVSASILAAYGIPWLGNVIHPLLIAIGLRWKRVSLIVFGVFGQVVIFSITGFKSIALSGVLIVGLLIASRKNGREFGLWMAWGAAAVVGLGVAVGKALNLPLLTHMATSRLFVTPGLLSGHYYDFFSTHPKVQMSDGVLSSFASYPYALEPDQVIGSNYFGDADVHANANIWADAFANFGVGGILVFSLALAGVLWVYDSIVRVKDRRTAVMLLGIPCITLSNTALETSLLTHGIGLVILLMFLMPPQSKQTKREMSISPNHST